MKIDGVCHCSQIAFEAELDPGKVSICRCTDGNLVGGIMNTTTVPKPLG